MAIRGKETLSSVMFQDVPLLAGVTFVVTIGDTYSSNCHPRSVQKGFIAELGVLVQDGNRQD